MAAVQDILETIFVLRGVPAWKAGMEGASKATDHLSSRLSSLNRTSIATGSAATTIFGLMGKAALMAGDDAAKFQRALFGFRSFGNPFPMADLQEFSSELERRFGIADDSIAETVGILGTFGVTPQQAKDLTVPILDTAESLKALGVTSVQVANQVGKALQTGNTGALRRVGIIVDPGDVKRLGATAAIMKALENQGKGAADAFRRTLPGALQASRVATESLTESFGALTVGPLTAAASLATKLTYAFLNLPEPIKNVASGLVLLAAGALTAVSLRTRYLAYETGKLMHAHLTAAAAATKQAQAEAALGATLAGTSAASGVAGAAGGAAGKKGGKFAGRAKGGAAGLLAALGLDLLGGALPEGSGGQRAANAAGTVVAGASIGRLAGPWGMVAGAIAGAVKAGYDDYNRTPAGKAAAGQAAPGAAPTKSEEYLAQIAGSMQNVEAAIGNSTVARALGPGRLYADILAGTA